MCARESATPSSYCRDHRLRRLRSGAASTAAHTRRDTRMRLLRPRVRAADAWQFRRGPGLHRVRDAAVAATLHFTADDDHIVRRLPRGLVSDGRGGDVE